MQTMAGMPGLQQQQFWYGPVFCGSGSGMGDASARPESAAATRAERDSCMVALCVWSRWYAWMQEAGVLWSGRVVFATNVVSSGGSVGEGEDVNDIRPWMGGRDDI